MKKKVFKIIVIILIVIVAFIGSYLITYYVDKANNNEKKANISVVFDDNDYYQIPNSDVLTKEEALLEWPYIFKVSNSGNTASVYQILIDEFEENDIKNDVLSYILYLDEKEVQSGKLKELKNMVLYETTIDANKEQKYKLYIYKDSESLGSIYQYSILLDAILEGGPGF